ncbi:MAG TPA: hypothetical protein VNJ07_13605 [Chitinophagales bacterium]|nr:hypothetical protein [Chitinophagales bacterium]
MEERKQNAGILVREIKFPTAKKTMPERSCFGQIRDGKSRSQNGWMQIRLSLKYLQASKEQEQI